MDSDDPDFYTYGTPLEPIEEDTVPRKKAFTVEDQIVTDEHGRRRFHGAFTGGFSAGFFNTVGTPEGWEPSTFKSSRSTRMQAKEQNAFDFMDDEDRSEHGICPMSLKVKSSFNDKSSDHSELKRKGTTSKNESFAASKAVQNVFRPVRITIGVKLLMKMGWKPGQGVGPRVTKRQKKYLQKERENMGKVYGCELPSNIAKTDGDSDESDIDVDLDGITFAPDDYKTYIAQPKLNLFGLGYQGMNRRTVLSSKKPEFSKLTVNGKTIRGQAFGVSVFEEEDEDIYGTEDMTNYDFALEPEIEAKKSKKPEFSQIGCIEGFHICPKPCKLKEKFPLPQIPADYVPLKSRRSRWDSTERSEPRAKVKTAAERVRIIDDNNTIPGTSKSTISEVKDSTANDLMKKIESMPPVPTSSFKPFATDSEKQSRYERFLMFRKFGLKDKVDMIYPPTMTEWEKEREKSEFEQAACLYRPMSEDMANRFTVGGQEDIHDLLKPVEKTRDLKQEVLIQAAKQKRFGALTRRKLNWMPDKILCKRFNVPEPVTGHLEKTAEATKTKGPRTSIFEFLKTSESFASSEQSDREDIKPKIKEEELPDQTEVVAEQPDPLPEPETATEMSSVNDPGDLTDDVKDITDKVDLFKAVFLSSSDEEDEPEPEPETPAASWRHLAPTKPIEYSPPRGIFKNIDLDKLRQKPASTKEATPPNCRSPVDSNTGTSSHVEVIETPLQPEIKEEEPQLYGPIIPKNLLANAAVQPSHVFHSKSKKKEVWVEKSHKHKKHKKSKKHKKH